MKYLNIPVFARCEDLLKEVPDNSVDAVITDPPYALTNDPNIVELLEAWLVFKPYEFSSSGFMGASWDNYIPGPDIWREVYRTLKPGGHLAAFAGSRTQDLMGLAIRMAGFTIRDTFVWIYSSGFPKSMDISKAFSKRGDHDLALRWDGWGTQVKPANEPILICQKPFEGSFLDVAETFGTGPINIRDTAVGTEEFFNPPAKAKRGSFNNSFHGEYKGKKVVGRRPSNVILECTCENGPVGGKSGRRFTKNNTAHNKVYNDSGETRRKSSGWTGEVAPVHEEGCPANVVDQQSPDGAARFFKQIYCAKAPKSERWVWCPTCELVISSTEEHDHEVISHPTQKPLKLMRYLVKMFTQPGGVVMDPFGGTFTTAVAARDEGMDFISCDMEKSHVRIGEVRLSQGRGKPTQEKLGGGIVCPGCRSKGKLKLIPKILVKRALDKGKKVTCAQCLGRFKPSELGSM